MSGFDAIANDRLIWAKRLEKERDQARARVVSLEAGIRELFASQDGFNETAIRYIREEQCSGAPNRESFAWHGLAKLVGLVDADGEPVAEEIAKLLPDQSKDGN